MSLHGRAAYPIPPLSCSRVFGWLLHVKISNDGHLSVGEHSHSKARQVSQSTVGTAQNVPVHFGSKVRRSVETAQNVPVLFGSKDETIQNVPVHFGSQSPIKTTQNVSVHFGSKVRSPVEDAQNVPVHFGSKVRKCPKCTTTFNKPDKQVLAE
jgi:hypothetical protein